MQYTYDKLMNISTTIYSCACICVYSVDNIQVQDFVLILFVLIKRQRRLLVETNLQLFRVSILVAMAE